MGNSWQSEALPDVCSVVRIVDLPLDNPARLTLADTRESEPLASIEADGLAAEPFGRSHHPARDAAHPPLSRSPIDRGEGLLAEVAVRSH